MCKHIKIIWDKHLKLISLILLQKVTLTFNKTTDHKYLVALMIPIYKVILLQKVTLIFNKTTDHKYLVALMIPIYKVSFFYNKKEVRCLYYLIKRL